MIKTLYWLKYLVIRSNHFMAVLLSFFCQGFKNCKNSWDMRQVWSTWTATMTKRASQMSIFKFGEVKQFCTRVCKINSWRETTSHSNPTLQVAYILSERLSGQKSRAHSRGHSTLTSSLPDDKYSIVPFHLHTYHKTRSHDSGIVYCSASQLAIKPRQWKLRKCEFQPLCLRRARLKVLKLKPGFD